MTPRALIALATFSICLPNVALAGRSGMFKYMRIPRDLDDPLMPAVIFGVACLVVAGLAKLLRRAGAPGGALWQMAGRLRIACAAGFILAFGTFMLDAMQQRTAAQSQTAEVRYTSPSGGAKFVSARE